MPDYFATTGSEPRIRAWLVPADPEDDIEDPLVPRESGWRITIETVDEGLQFNPLRSTWEPTIQEAMAHAEDYFLDKPVWINYQTGEVVEILS